MEPRSSKLHGAVIHEVLGASVLLEHQVRVETLSAPPLYLRGVCGVFFEGVGHTSFPS